ncbi:RiPP maturation radical SAM C-methyltransferase [Dactylosporangium sp. McL0621]|uniref:RiPP maturation radical SAM C-methyltransferase n=1 Tax=Dactylosporangium sp. McL0621 TaxID=3415678 RepID=UPI003CF65565
MPVTPAAGPIVLVAMPFLHADRPSIPLGLLKAVGVARGFPVRTLHACLDFAARLGPDYYALLADHRGRQVGDWLFSVEAFGADAPDPDGRRLLKAFGDELGYLGDRLPAIRDHDVPAFLDELERELGDAAIVGFSATFQQSVASFALARRLKRRRPGVVTIFGGANFDGPMGPALARSLDVIDYAVVGEGDDAFPALLDALAKGEDPAAVPGVATRSRHTPPAPPRPHLDDLPVPDYDEYFTRAAGLGLPVEHVALPFESARGCWWGARHHCTFCGLNATTMAFRAKSPERVLAELDAQSRRHRTFRFEAVDNILGPRLLRELVPALADREYQLFYEVKANLDRAQLRGLAQAGVTRLQPGLESLSSAVLRRMDKGVRAAQNVNLLRWARYYGIDIGWNILWGFPGETAAEYAAQTALVPHLAHLAPPADAGPVWLERFSPLFTTFAKRPEESYSYVYPSTVDLDEVAYFFDYDPVTAVDPAVYASLRDAVAAWTARWREPEPPLLVYRAAPGFLQIYDTRDPAATGTYTFRDTLAAIYLACSARPRTLHGLQRDLTLPAATIAAAFKGFAERGLMMLDEDRALSLALPATPGR